MKKTSKIYVAGADGLVGSSVVRKLKENGFNKIITKTHKELDLTDSKKVSEFFEKEKPEYVVLAAAKVGGILANSQYPVDFIMENLKIQMNVIENCYKYNVKKLINLGSSCIYPNTFTEPIKEDDLLSNKLEKTNEQYAIAKIAGIKMCQAYNRQYNTKYITLMPCNLYGINDNFNLETGHVLPNLIRKFYEAKRDNRKEVILWGDGTPLREFMYVDDLANAILMLLDIEVTEDVYNVGTGKDISISELASLIAKVVNYKGNIIYDINKPNGTYRKLMDNSKIRKLGWKPKIKLEDGIKNVYNWYIENENKKEGNKIGK